MLSLHHSEIPCKPWSLQEAGIITFNDLESFLSLSQASFRFLFLPCFHGSLMASLPLDATMFGVRPSFAAPSASAFGGPTNDCRRSPSRHHSGASIKATDGSNAVSLPDAVKASIFHSLSHSTKWRTAIRNCRERNRHGRLSTLTSLSSYLTLHHGCSRRWFRRWCRQICFPPLHKAFLCSQTHIFGSWRVKTQLLILFISKETVMLRLVAEKAGNNEKKYKNPRAWKNRDEIFFPFKQFSNNKNLQPKKERRGWWFSGGFWISDPKS